MDTLDTFKEMFEARLTMTLVQSMLGKAANEIMGKDSEFVQDLTYDVNALASRARKMARELEAEMVAETNAIPNTIRDIGQEVEAIKIIYRKDNGYLVEVNGIKLDSGQNLLEILRSYEGLGITKG